MGHTDFVTCLAPVPGGGLASGSRDASAIVWDAVSAEPAARLAGGHAYAVSGVAVAGDGKEVLTCSLDGSVKAWAPGGGEPTRVLAGHTGPVQCVLALPGGGVASGAGEGVALVWGPGGGGR